MAAALTQLLDNTIKRSLAASRIEIGLDTNDGKAILSVRSHGAVVPSAELERTRARRTGLGWSIVRRIAETHQGQVWLESDAARGTVYFFVLPPKSKEVRIAAASV